MTRQSNQRIRRPSVRGIASTLTLGSMVWAGVAGLAPVACGQVDNGVSSLVLESPGSAPRRLEAVNATSLADQPVRRRDGRLPKLEFFVHNQAAPSIIREMANFQEKESPVGSGLNSALQEPDGMPDLLPQQSSPEATDDIAASPIEKDIQPWTLETTIKDFSTPKTPPQVPDDLSVKEVNRIPFAPPTVVGTTAFWTAPNLYYEPLLWEDPLLERYGRSAEIWGVQPVLSGVHFTVDGALAPFRAFKYRCQVETPLAFERPGSCTQETRELHFGKH